MGEDMYWFGANPYWEGAGGEAELQSPFAFRLLDHQ